MNIHDWNMLRSVVARNEGGSIDGGKLYTRKDGRLFHGM